MIERAVPFATAAVVALALFFGHGADASRLAWIGGAAAALWAAAAILLPPPRLSRAGWALFAAVAAFGVWSAMSILWSIAPDRSWDAANRVLAYIALGALGTYLARVGTARVAAAATVLLGAVGGWALLGRVVPALGPDTDRVDRLRAPVGYWNVLAFLLAALVPLALLLARRRRVEGTVVLYGAFVALLLTYSRGGLAVAVGAGLLWAALTSGRLEPLALLVVALAVAAPVAALDADGLPFALALLAGGAVAAGLGWAVGLRPRNARAVVALAAAVVLVGLVAGAVRVGNPVAWTGDKLDEFRNPPSVQPVQSEGRFRTLSSSNRWTWWNEALDAWRQERLAGTGAASFDLARRPLRQNPLDVREPHSLALEVLSETGVVGALLFAAAVAAAAAVCARRAREPAAAALVAGIAAFFVQALVDIHWSYVAAAGPVFIALGVLAATGVGDRRPRGFLAPAAAVLVALACIYSLAGPAVSARYTARAQERIAAHDYDGAVDAARTARSLNPLAVEPIFAEALATGFQRRDARRLYLRAIELQPANWRTWYELGQYELVGLNALDDAYLDLDKAYSLDPRNVVVGRALAATKKKLESR
jgi:tetratricopeptide (TPR) repeat protein